MRTNAWALRYIHNGSLLRNPNKTPNPLPTLLFKTRKEALDYKEALSYKATVKTVRVEIRIEPKLSLINRS